MNIDGLLYLHNLAGQALDRATTRIAELEQELLELRATRPDDPGTPGTS